MRSSTVQKLCSWLAVLALTLVAPVAAWAQCAMCKTAAENMDPAGVKYLNIAILLLLVPPAAMFCGFFYLAYKRRDPPTAKYEREVARTDISTNRRDHLTS